MRFSRLATISAVASALAIAGPASAATLIFDFAATPLFGAAGTAVFELDSNPTPDRINDQSAFGIAQIFFNNVAGTYNGVAGTANIGFGQGNVAKIQVLGTNGTRINLSATGPNPIFTGPLSAPVFSAGDFALNRGSLNVSAAFAAVPEPATWAFMIFGFGAIGGAMRNRRKVKVSKVSFA